MQARINSGKNWYQFRTHVGMGDEDQPRLSRVAWLNGLRRLAEFEFGLAGVGGRGLGRGAWLVLGYAMINSRLIHRSFTALVVASHTPAGLMASGRMACDGLSHVQPLSNKSQNPDPKKEVDPLFTAVEAPVLIWPNSEFALDPKMPVMRDHSEV
ncbi:hypothetical protein B0H14DRAFT_2603078 [Mycena olivaceomarginata]|nr:hypothetical protein B0H14DRAFT_2603078 [Mycena olivaceomarginata]